MKSPGLISIALFLAVSALGGCAEDTATAPAEDEGIAADELSAQGLRALSAIQGTVVAGSSVKLAYKPGNSLYPRAVPYLAVEVVAAGEPVREPTQTASGSSYPLNGQILNGQSITVAGDFPGRPRVLVVDENFERVASATAQTLADGTELASFAVPRGPGKRFILVRDGLWSMPMEFEIGVGR